MDLLKLSVSEFVKAQHSRVASGNRNFSVFVKSLGIKPGEPVYKDPKFRRLMEYIPDGKKVLQDIDDAKSDSKASKKLNAAATLIIDQLKKDYKLITYAVVEALYGKTGMQYAKNDDIVFNIANGVSVSKLEKALGVIFANDAMSEHTQYHFINRISTYTFLRTFIQYSMLEKQCLNSIKAQVASFPIWNDYLKYVKGCGELTAACFISKINPATCMHITKLFRYAGLDVVYNPESEKWEGRTNGFRRGKSAHLIKRQKSLATGEVMEYDAISYNPFIKTRCYLLFGSLMKAKNPWYTDVYWAYRNRIEQRNNLLPEDKRLTLGHINMMAARYVSKMFLQDMWIHLRLMNGYIPYRPYADTKLNNKSHIRTINLEQSDMEHGEVVMELIDFDQYRDPKYLTGKLYNQLSDEEKAKDIW